MGTVSVLKDENISRDKWWHKDVNVLHATELRP